MEREYYGRACRIVLDLYPTICRDCLQKQLTPSDCQKVADGIRQLRPAQLNVTKNVASRGDYGECEMPLMYILLSCCCWSLPSPKAGWRNSPITGTGIGDDIEQMMSAYNDMPDLLSSESFSALKFWPFLDITKDICTRLDKDTINATYVTKSFSGSYVQRLETLNSQPMQQTEQDEYIKKMRKIQEQIDHQNKEKDNFNRLSRIIMDLFSNLYHDILQYNTPPSKCPSPADLKSKSVRLFPEEESALKDVPSINSYRNCDIGLMYKVLRNACPLLPKPTAGWGKTVPPSAVLLGDDIERIRETRNKAFGHISSTPVSEKKYQEYVKTATDICKRMDSSHTANLRKSVSGTYQDKLNEILTETLDTEMNRSYIDALAAQAKREEDILKTVTEIGLETQKSISRAEGNIVQTTKDDGSETRKEMKTLDVKLTDTINEKHVETQKSISRIEENVGKKITEGNVKVQNEMKALGKRWADTANEYQSEVKRKRQTEEGMSAKLSSLLAMEEEKKAKRKEKEIHNAGILKADKFSIR